MSVININNIIAIPESGLSKNEFSLEISECVERSYMNSKGEKIHESQKRTVIKKISY